MADTPYQSLYRRYRPQRFTEMLGQDHVVVALRNAVRDGKVAHAYLFSGPRGTGKTSAARILAKALNCANPIDGEPDGTCESCVQIQQGASLDVNELDAASNNGVDAMRDLVSRAALGTPGRWKIYIVDEVHMLSTAASNALLKTLEEPPAHVVFVLATTDPQKVLPTIRSRTQHFEFRLLSPELLSQLVTRINGEANLHVPTEALDLVVRRGKGSARDTLSVLDQVAAAGIVDDEHEIIDEIVEALCERDAGRALVAVAEATNSGRDPQRLTVEILEYLRNGFLALMAKGLLSVPDNAAERIEAQARRLGAPALVRAMEAIGEALAEMRDAPEPRVALEVTLVRLTKPELSVDPAALLERIEKLERGVVTRPGSVATDSDRTDSDGAQHESTPTRSASRSAVSPKTPTALSSTPLSGPPPASSPQRPALGGLRRGPGQPAGSAPSRQVVPSLEAQTTAEEQSAPGPSSPATAAFPTRDQLVEAWGDVLLDRLPQRARSRYRMGRFLAVENGRAIYALPNAIHRDRCEEVRNEVELVLREHFGQRVPLQLTVEGNDDSTISTEREATATSTNADAEAREDELIELDETTPAVPVAVGGPEERLMRAFPGAEEMS